MHVGAVEPAACVRAHRDDRRSGASHRSTPRTSRADRELAAVGPTVTEPASVTVPAHGRRAVATIALREHAHRRIVAPRPTCRVDVVVAERACQRRPSRAARQQRTSCHAVGLDDRRGSADATVELARVPHVVDDDRTRAASKSMTVGHRERRARAGCRSRTASERAERDEGVGVRRWTATPVCWRIIG